MSLNIFQWVSLLIILLLVIYIWYRYKIIYITNFILGMIIIHFCTDFYLSNGVFNRNNSPVAKEGALFYLANDIFFSILFLTSFFHFLFFKGENRRKYYFVIPIIVFIIILFVIICIEKSFKSITFFGFSLFLSFFPLYFLTYFLKYVKGGKE